MKGVGRANGRSVVAAAAYRAGERLHDEITGLVQDYQMRGGVEETFILARDDAPTWARDRARIWNAAERAELRANGRLATELELALPHELTPVQRRELLHDYLRPLVERHGVVADVAIHTPGEGRDHRNVHAHVLITHRALHADGFGEIAHERTVTRKRKGQEVRETIAGIAATPTDVKALRRDWELAINRAYERADLDIRVDHRSHKDRGLEEEPTKHLGPTATAIERRGAESERGAVNREITERNADRASVRGLEKEAEQLTAEIVDLEQERAARRYDPLRTTERTVDREQFEGRYDVLRAAEPPAEIVHLFHAGAGRAVEHAAELFDRDAAEAAWTDRMLEAAIARADPAPSELQGAAQPRDKLAVRELDAASSLPEAGGVAADPGWRNPGRLVGGILRGIGRMVTNLVEQLADSIAPAPPPTQDQADRAARVREEKRADHEVNAAERETEAIIDRQAEEQRTRDIARTLDNPTAGDPEEERFRSIMRGAARERDRENDRER